MGRLSTEWLREAAGAKGVTLREVCDTHAELAAEVLSLRELLAGWLEAARHDGMRPPAKLVRRTQVVVRGDEQ